MKQRIQKVLAAAGVESRRHIEQMVLDGRVSVNGRVATELPILIDPAVDTVELDGEPVRLGPRKPTRLVYILMHKPKGVYCTNVSQGDQIRAIDLLPPGFAGRVYPVGRLDAESKGLLLLTNDGDLTHRLTHPRYGVVKTYRATVEGWLSPQAAEQLQSGVWLADKQSGKGFKTGRTHIRIVSRGRHASVVEIDLREGRNRQVRRMLAKVGHKVRELIRTRIGPLTIKGLVPGQFRELTDREVRLLRKAVEPAARGSVGPASFGPADPRRDSSPQRPSRKV